MTIVVRKKGQRARKVENIPFDRESELQEYISLNPEVIPLDDIRENLQLLVLAREFSTTAGSVDALAVDEEGAIYIIETKLYKNPDKRHVVAQVLDYGAGIWARYPGYDDFERALESSANKLHKKPLREKFPEFFGFDESGAEDMLESMKENFRSGRFTFIVLMDELHDQLKDLITFINANSQFNLLGCELELYREGDIEILIPKLYGVEITKTNPGHSPRKSWDESSFFEAVSRMEDENVKEKIRKMYEFSCKTTDHITWGTGKSRGSFNPKYDRISARAPFTFYSDGNLEVNFKRLSDNEMFRQKLKDELTARLELEIPEDYENRLVSFEPNEWVDKHEKIIEIIKDSAK